MMYTNDLRAPCTRCYIWKSSFVKQHLSNSGHFCMNENQIVKYIQHHIIHVAIYEEGKDMNQRIMFMT